MYDIVVTEFVDQWAVDDLAKDYKVHYDRTLVDKPEELAKLAATSPAIVIRNRTQIRGPVLAAMKNLKAIGRLGVGLDNIDMEECARRNIAVFPATGANTVSVAEYVIGATLVGLRDVWKANADVLAGKWPRNDLMLGEAAGRRLALIGFGGIARAVASRAKALEMKISAFDPHVSADDPAWAQYGVEREADLDALLAKADVISLHVPFTPQTRNLIDAARLAKMKSTALLINTARGGIIDETALAASLTAGKLGGAVLDVYEQEPLKAGSVLEGVPRLWLTPHIAGVTAEGNIRVSTVTVANVRRELQRLGIKGST